MRRKGYDVAQNRSEMENTPLWRALGCWGSSRPAILHLPTRSNLPGRSLTCFDGAPGDSALTTAKLPAGRRWRPRGRKAASQNEGERMLRELVALDEAVATALSFAGADSLILVVGKQSIGGLRLNGYPFRDDKGVAVVGINTRNPF